MLKKIHFTFNIILILIIISLAIYAIVLNYEIHKIYEKNTLIQRNFDKNKQINKQLELELITKTSHIFVNRFAKDKLKMHLPKKIHNLN